MDLAEGDVIPLVPTEAGLQKVAKEESAIDSASTIVESKKLKIAKAESIKELETVNLTLENTTKLV